MVSRGGRAGPFPPGPSPPHRIPGRGAMGPPPLTTNRGGSMGGRLGGRAGGGLGGRMGGGGGGGGSYRGGSASRGANLAGECQ